MPAEEIKEQELYPIYPSSGRGVGWAQSRTDVIPAQPPWLLPGRELASLAVLSQLKIVGSRRQALAGLWWLYGTALSPRTRQASALLRCARVQSAWAASLKRPFSVAATLYWVLYPENTYTPKAPCLPPPTPLRAGPSRDTCAPVTQLEAPVPPQGNWCPAGRLRPHLGPLLRTGCVGLAWEPSP